MASPYDHHDYEIPPPHFTGSAADFGLSDDDETTEEEDDDEEDEEEEEDEDGEYSPRAPREGPSTASNQPIVIPDESLNEIGELEEGGDGGDNKRRRIEGGEASCSSLGIDGSQGNEWNRTDIDGLFCPICMEAWTDDGDHNICCLPCGHIYGMSCIKKWLQQQKRSGKCPQCNRKCSLRDVRKLYASRVVTVDEESQKKIRSLEAKCAALESKGADWHKKESQWRKREAALHLVVQKLTKRNTFLEKLLLDMQSRQSGLINGNRNYHWRSQYENNFGLKSHGNGSFCNFELQQTFHLDGARVFDLDASNQILLVAQKPRGIGGAHFLSKMSLIHPFEMEDILLPSTTTGIRDIHFSPSNSRLALYASLEKKLSVLSMESNNPVLSYDLQDPAWSCSWDCNSSHYMYAGLQNGSVLVFDMRQTAAPVKSLIGLTSNPVHSVHSLAQTTSPPSAVNTILSASAIGLCQWNVDSEERPSVVPETDNQGVCISLAYCPSSDDIVVSYRPKFDMSLDVPLSQTSPTPSQSTGQGVVGSHILLKRQGSDHFQKMGSSYANLSKIRLPKCVIIDKENQSRIFAAGDEVTCELVLHELPSFRVLQHVKLPAQARDVRYSPSHGILGCLTEKTLQLFHTKLS